ncbi:5-hydroxytryptamine receptor 2b [Lasius niger]|uniref:5-hydroxytryptamine receptor 2b n=1 Tax=Lasius niger TaxID=67767 RepID=A0A0J7KU81_LASNI|nr:5-hydroxytryptamine receptor 2b [Lasius niger]
MSCSRTSLSAQEDFASPWKHRRRASTYNEAHLERTIQAMGSPKAPRKRSFSFHEQSSCRKNEDDSTTTRRKCHDKTIPDGPITLPPPCTCPYFGESSKRPPPSSEIVIVSSDTMKPIGGKVPEMGLLADAARPVVGNKGLEMGLLGRNNSARSTEGVKNYEQLTHANSVVTWRGGRRGSSLGTCR